MTHSEVAIAECIGFYLYSLDNGGAERVTAILASTLADNDINVTVFVMKAASSTSYQLSDKVKIVDISNDPALEGANSSLIFNLKRIFVLRRLVIATRPQVLFTMMVDSNVIGILALVGTGIPCVVSERNDPGRSSANLPWSIMRKLVYGLSYSVIAQTSRVRSWILKNTFASAVEVIPNPIQMPIVDGLPVVDVPKQRGPMIMGVGRLCRQKQFTHLVEAFKLVSERHPDWWLAILGEGEDRDDLQKLIDSYGLTGRALLVGRVGNMTAWYSEAKLFVLTSLFEGYPNALIEAMANGVASIAYDCPTEVIENDVNGILVDADDVSALAQKMELLMSDRVFARKISEEAQEVQFSLEPDTIAERWLATANLTSRALKT